MGAALLGAAIAVGVTDPGLPAAPAADKPMTAAAATAAPTDTINAGFLELTLLSSRHSSADGRRACAGRLKRTLSGREAHDDPQAMRYGSLQRDLRPVALGDGFDNGQAQATAAF